MNTEKKNQHYIPKFYLKNFSYKKNDKQIGIFNLKSSFFFQTSKLKTQGSKNFFYGYDGVIEDGLSEIEGLLSQTINKLITTRKLPLKNSKDHVKLLIFIALTDVRNPVKINNMKSMMVNMKERILESSPEADVEKLVPEMSHEEVVNLALATIPEITQNILDLDYKLLINETGYPFISSDFPIVKYNQFLEKKKWGHSKSGYSVNGLQIFFPLNSEIVLHFFDSAIYRVGDKRQKNVPLKDKKDVDRINQLQLVNCLETIYFNEKASEEYIRSISIQSLKFNRANSPKSELNYIVRDGDDKDELLKSGKKNLIILGSSDCETDLEITCIKIHSKGKVAKLNSSMAQLRKFTRSLKD